MTVFYRGPNVRITHRTFEVGRPRRCCFAIRELWRVQVVVSGHGRPIPVIVGSSGLAGVAVVMVVTNGVGVALPLVIVLGVASLATAGTCLRVPARSYELRAVYRGEAVMLYATSNAQEFGQIRRGLLRALEQVTAR